VTIYSSRSQLERIASLAIKFSMLPFAPSDSVPGAVMEAILAEVRDASVLRTYDFIDVLRANSGIGWQVKSTKAGTPVTWKRAKIPEQDRLINASRDSAVGAQQLGDAIIGFCNAHAVESLKQYGLDEIGYARLVVMSDGSAVYFERPLVSKQHPELFSPKDFVWSWSTAKRVTKKEQLSALHGRHVSSGRKWWAWHGLGENQLHFSGESEWWPTDLSHAVKFSLPSASNRMSMQDLIELLEVAAIPVPVDPAKNPLGK